MLLSASLLLGGAVPAAAHVTEPAGPYRLSIGWGNEPPLSGSPNVVEVAVATGAGAPVAGASLTAEVSFGAARRTFPLLPGERPGSYQAVLVPTRPGSYAFHVRGTVKGRVVDVQAICSPRTFECVTASSAVAFPARDPSNAELATRLDRALPRAERAADKARTAQRLAIVALAIAAASLGVALRLVAHARRTRG